jgi:hypothetical protein
VSEPVAIKKPSSISSSGSSGKMPLLDLENYSTAITALIVAYVRRGMRVAAC